LIESGTNTSDAERTPPMASANKHFLSSMTNLRFRIAFSYSNRTQQPMNPAALWATSQPAAAPW
ncbi:hypothetical protein, partial [Pseudomonas putida]|uniref:hypothetical protein n=1 Tax=Pseudomonas putida TaxID=303 RepID=UPI00202313BA